MNLLKFRTIFMLLSALLLAGIFPSSAGAYSYGNANTEAVAETFKLIASKLSTDRPDWTAAGAAYNEIRSELDSHFGKEVTKELDGAFASKDKDRVLQDWKGVLILNLDRRFQYAEEGFGSYSDAKLLLAKARATYEALKPYLSGTSAEGKLTELDQAFDKALEALGNPGLLGVGKKEPNAEAFKQNISFIYDTVAPLFPMNNVKSGGGASLNPTASPAAHAPMAETNKTNSVVTIAAIVVVLAGAGLLFWRIRRRKS